MRIWTPPGALLTPRPYYSRFYHVLLSPEILFNFSLTLTFKISCKRSGTWFSFDNTNLQTRISKYSYFCIYNNAEEISCGLLPEPLFSFNTFFLSIFLTKTFKSLAKFQVRDFPLTFWPFKPGHEGTGIPVDMTVV